MNIRKHPRHDKHADKAGAQQEGDGEAKGFGDRPDAHRTARHYLHHHSEDDEAQHIVGDRRAQDDPGLYRRQSAQVAEHAGGNPYARRCECGAKEDRCIGGLAEQQAHPRARCKWHSDADDSNGHR